MAVAQAYNGRPVDLRVGEIELRLAETPDEVEAAQALRYRIFYEEMSAQPTPQMAATRRDFDSFDPYCDHLLIIDHKRGAGAAGVVGTYRLMRREGAARRGQFYSIDEYNIDPLLAVRGEILELGRSCISAEYRTRSAMQLMWRGIADYVMFYEIAVMFGCASFPGIDPAEHALPLTYLYDKHLAPLELRPVALPERHVEMRMVDPAMVDARAALNALPPLIKGYLRLGGFVGDGAVIDEQFNTIDVSIVVKTDWVTSRYIRHYTRDNTKAEEP